MIIVSGPFSAMRANSVAYCAAHDGINVLDSSLCILHNVSAFESHFSDSVKRPTRSINAPTFHTLLINRSNSSRG